MSEHEDDRMRVEDLISVPVRYLEDIYYPDELPKQQARWDKLVAEFKKRFGVEPRFISRSPGRVNIIGEHIDYSLFGVLPMAISSDMLLAVNHQASGQDGTSMRVRIHNLEEERFPSRQFTAGIGENGVDIDATQHEWTNYFKSGLRASFDMMRKEGLWTDRAPVDMDVLVDGTVPAGGGLSSSAAFVTASAMAALFANGFSSPGKKTLAELAIAGERAVGVNSGGMDQAAAVLSEKGSALHVKFLGGLDAKPIKIPPTDPPSIFLAAQSFVAADKHKTAPVQYNLRVVECSLAAAYLHAVTQAPGIELPEDSSPLGVSLGTYANTYISYHDSTNSGDFTKLALDNLTKEEGYTREEVAKVLNMSVVDLDKRFMSKFPVRADRFKLRQRALHVFSENLRVEHFTNCLGALKHATQQQDPDKEDPDGNVAKELTLKMGELMNETQESCEKVYECSCDEIDDMCRIARRAGAYGSRLTGAGWGGCTVHMVPEDKVEAVKGALMQEYYLKRDPATLPKNWEDLAFVESRPGSGTCVSFYPKENDDHH